MNIKDVNQVTFLAILNHITLIWNSVLRMYVVRLDILDVNSTDYFKNI